MSQHNRSHIHLPCGGGKGLPSADVEKQQWRCPCGKLLGEYLAHNLIHVRAASGSDYIAALPTIAICSKCNKVNVMTALEKDASET